MDIINKLKSLGVEVTTDIEKAFGGEWITSHEHEKKLAKVETERDSLKTQLDEATTTLKGFDGKNIDAMEKQIAEWKEKAEQAEKDFKAKLENDERDRLIDEHIKDLTFTSDFAKRLYIQDLKASDVKVSNGKLFGITEFKGDYDQGAFKDAKQVEAEKGRTNIVGTTINSSPNGSMTKEQIRAIKDTSERQRAMAEHSHLFFND